MKIDAKALVSLIRTVVREEVERIAPKIVQEHLSERYIKKLLSEKTQSSPRRMQELLATDTDMEEEVTPEPPENDDRGIYAPTAPVRNEGKTNVLLSDDNPFRAIYEGVSPIGQSSPVPDVPLNKEQFDFSAMSKMVDAMDRQSMKSKKMSTEAMEERRLEALRRSLEVKVG